MRKSNLNKDIMKMRNPEEPIVNMIDKASKSFLSLETKKKKRIRRLAKLYEVITAITQGGGSFDYWSGR